MVQPGDCVILNAANSTVGQIIIQLCHLLQLRCVAVVRECKQPLEGFTQLVDRLKALGASHVIQDSGSLKVMGLALSHVWIFFLRNLDQPHTCVTNC